MNHLSLAIIYPLEPPDRQRVQDKLNALLPGRHEIVSLKDTDPLPPQCNVCLGLDTPHMSGVMTEADYSRLLTDVFLDNFGRFVRGETLLNVVGAS